MHGEATFFDARFNNKEQYPVAAKTGVRKHAQYAGQDHIQAGGAAILSALDPRAESAGRVL